MELRLEIYEYLFEVPPPISSDLINTNSGVNLSRNTWSSFYNLSRVNHQVYEEATAVWYDSLIVTFSFMRYDNEFERMGSECHCKNELKMMMAFLSQRPHIQAFNRKWSYNSPNQPRLNDYLRNLRSVHLRLPPVTREAWINRFNDNEYGTMYIEDASWLLPFLKNPPNLSTIFVVVPIEDELTYDDGSWRADTKPVHELELFQTIISPLKFIKSVTLDMSCETTYLGGKLHFGSVGIYKELENAGFSYSQVETFIEVGPSTYDLDLWLS